MVKHLDWIDLPGSVRREVEQRTGPVLGSENATEGMNSTVACTIRTGLGPVFVKAAERDHPYADQWKEAVINSYVVPLSPTLLWRVEESGWDVLGFEYLPGRSADLSPGSADLPKVAAVMAQLTRLQAPPELLRPIEHYFDGYAEPTELGLLAGTAILHTDLNPHNFRISNGKARILDWASPGRGAPWVDLAFLAMRLVDAGHTPASADAWAAQFPSWRAAPADAIAIHARAHARQRRYIAEAAPRDWTIRLAACAERWMYYWLRRDVSGSMLSLGGDHDLLAGADDAGQGVPIRER
jgi:hypothetical protein